MKQKTKTPTKKTIVKKKRKYTKKKDLIPLIDDFINDLPEKTKEKFTKDKFEKAGLLLRQIEVAECDLSVWQNSMGLRGNQIILANYQYGISFKPELFEKLKRDHIELLKKEITELKEKFENI